MTFSLDREGIQFMHYLMKDGHQSLITESEREIYEQKQFNGLRSKIRDTSLKAFGIFFVAHYGLSKIFAKQLQPMQNLLVGQRIFFSGLVGFYVAYASYQTWSKTIDDFGQVKIAQNPKEFEKFQELNVFKGF
ncbi:UNKNOWN [Stylonychia lemnae]|uniref:Uncharacterized protein n=1 Tax=Stylonychia lemnae TaxID=5949 RepID=A0A078BAI7_STYLE|nr:UNKNOWN [Stylonychia lemnae]|eukprot:CDW91241.1 UNKNOWN [Stylonychia lemnae]